MKEWKLLCASGILALLTALKLLAPDASAALRLKTLELLSHDGDYRAVLETLGDRLSHSGDARTAPEQAPSAPSPAPTADILLLPVTAAPRGCSYYLSHTVEEAAPSPGEDGPLLPAAVAAFLERQAAFSDALPENVAYGYAALPFDFAVPVSGCNSSGFGYRLHPILNTVRFHYGTDFAADAGEPVLAFADGAVTFAGYDESFGNYVRIDHGDGWESLCAHCSRLEVVEGQRVSRGECVALVGATGLSTGPHLHFELTQDGVYRNPEYYFNE